jgi:hypothetical protein
MSKDQAPGSALGDTNHVVPSTRGVHRELRRRMRAALVALMIVFSGGCSIDGLPVAEGGGYRSQLGADSQRELDLLSRSDRIRLLDPCAMVDKTAITAAIGTPLDIGPDRYLDSCQIVFDRSTAKNEVGYLTVHLSVAEDGTGELSKVGDRVLSILSLGNQCSAALTYDDERAFSYTISGESGTEACAQIRQIATVSAPLLNTFPRRSESADLPPGKAWTLDPCTALSTLYGPEEEFDVSSFDPFACDYRVGGYREDQANAYGDEKNRWTIRYFHPSQTYAANPPEQARTLQIAGVQATEKPLRDNFCKIDAFVGIDHPFPVIGGISENEQWFEGLTVSGYTCEETRRVAVAAVKEYQNA